MARRPAPLASASVWESWHAREAAPEMACASAWSDACRAWWQHPTDGRLRRRVLDQLFLDEAALSTWRSLDLDRAALLRAHAHVTSTRAGVERTTLRRVLTTGALRTGPIVAYRRSGVMFTFAEAGEVPRMIDELAGTYATLPPHPFVRAAWLGQAIGAVHPFVDANGGTGRFLSSIELARAWLPPFVLTELQRNTSYASAIADADDRLEALQHVIYDVVQQELAALLLDGDAGPTDWTAQSRARAETFTAQVDAAWRTAVDLPVTRDVASEGTLARFVRRGYRVPLAPVLARWASTSPVPVQLELVVAPVRAGDDIWTIASVAASVGDAGALGPMVHREPIATVFVAAPAEHEPHVSARFDRWLAKRIDHSVRGLSAWM